MHGLFVSKDGSVLVIVYQAGVQSHVAFLVWSADQLAYVRSCIYDLSSFGSLGNFEVAGEREARAPGGGWRRRGEAGA